MLQLTDSRHLSQAEDFWTCTSSLVYDQMHTVISSFDKPKNDEEKTKQQQKYATLKTDWILIHFSQGKLCYRYVLNQNIYFLGWENMHFKIYV